MGMKNDGQKPMPGGAGRGSGGGGGGGGGFIPSSFKAFSSYFRIVSSGASTVASTVKSAASAASAIVDRELESSRDQVHWTAFDKLECEGSISSRQVLLLGFRHGFQVWDVEDVSNVHNLVTRQDGPVSFMQILPKLLASKQPGDKFADSRPLLIICADGRFPGGNSIQEAGPSNATTHHVHELPNGSFPPTVVCFYSLRSHSYEHMLKFRSAVHLVRCSSRVIAVLQTSQLHCFDAATLEKEYSILTNPVPLGCGFGGGFGPLAVGPRWMAYSGSPVDVSNSGRVSPQELTPSASFPGPASNGSLVAHYAKESSKHLAAGILTLGDMGYKKLTKYYSESNLESGSACVGVHGVANGQSNDEENIGMVIVRDTVEKNVITQFRAHKSPISSLCFDPSGTLLVTASVQGHNINVFRIIPSSAVSGASYVHLYRLQRGLTNAVIQDISFSRDSEWIIISSSRGTSHLFAISPFGGSVGCQPAEPFVSSKGSGFGTMSRMPVCQSPNSGMKVLNQQSYFCSEPPITLSVVSRIKSGNNGWRNAVTGAAVAATGRMNIPSGVVSAIFHYQKGNDLYPETSFLKTNCCLLVFSSPGYLTQYSMRVSSGSDSLMALQGSGIGYDSSVDSDSKLVIDAVRKWNVCRKHNRKEREENIDIYGENGCSDSNKVFPEGMRKTKGVSSEVRGTLIKDKLASEEKYHMYISEAELEMHPLQVPLWTKPEMYFHTMGKDGITVSDEAFLSGEFEIERMPTRSIEVSSKELVPVFDYLQAPKFQPERSVEMLF
ncbi:OLC1v1022848C3 [Oldenlandia corymbosa var. corymbosa]|uniref:OLC1v1022848C3 n=1 Tax=Oldenlandia corymbosa var. corymbosa TaxID=529605 RepID=A0AAV1C1E9_OLDCO|nr:OLC1v1022848C3 [Oldenlandia corymbosa var. corymbosa]